MFLHCLTYALFISVLASLLVGGGISIFYFVMLFATHWVVDSWKSQFPHEDEYFWTIYVDQFFHLVVLVVFCLSILYL